MSILNNIENALHSIRAITPFVPEIGIVLGSGLGDFAQEVSESISIPYPEIPHFKKVTVPGHSGRLVLGTIDNSRVAILQGRYHFYEGHDIGDVVFPVRVLAKLGIKTLLLTNAAGGINPNLAAGDLMIIRDHINLMGVNPLRGENDERLGPRFPDMSGVYDESCQQVIASEMETIGLPVKKGVYAALSGPSYETPSEIVMLRAIGADAVGMSTVPEAIAARHLGTRVAAISCITNLAAGVSKTILDHKEVTDTANRVKGHFIRLLRLSILKLTRI